MAFRNPKRDVVLVLQADNPASGPNAAQQVTVRIGDQVLDDHSAELDQRAGARSSRSPPRSWARGDMVEMKFVVDKTFVPALEAAMASGDPRELGARFFHVFVQ